MGQDVRRGSPSGPKAMQKATVAFAAGTLTSQTVKTFTQPLAGARATDRVVVNSAGLPNNVGLAGARISAAGAVEIRLVNPTVADIAGGNVTMDCVLLTFNV
ncbi:MAG: hypothetical protein WC322_06970 [Candidatus Paceibacterota bacterium]